MDKYEDRGKTYGKSKQKPTNSEHMGNLAKTWRKMGNKQEELGEIWGNTEKTWGRIWKSGKNR